MRSIRQEKQIKIGRRFGRPVVIIFLFLIFLYLYTRNNKIKSACPLKTVILRKITRDVI